jgi:hypothetical protein
MADAMDGLRTLAWATAWADACEQRFGARLCRGCVGQGRVRCALADYARRVVAARYGAAPARTSDGHDDDPGGRDSC